MIRGESVQRRTALFVILSLSSGAPVACNKAPTNAAAANTVLGPPPLEIMSTLIDLRKQRAYSQMETYVLPQRARHLTSTLVAIDGFLVAEAELRAYIRDQAGFSVSETIDFSYFENGLGFFSRSVELLDENIGDDRAEVQYMVNGAIPAQTAEFVIYERHWRYDPGDGFEPELPRAFHEMTAGVRKFLDEIKSGRISDERLRDPESLARDYMRYLNPGLRLIPRPKEN